MENKQTIEVSIVVPVYNEEDSIKDLFLRISDTLNRLHKKYEVIFIDDGSIDSTFNVLKELSKDSGALKIIR
ncbi:MAG: glycosyltransferase, partial [Candidatus Nealsonbacteria bacterium]|nr:glycosyltransferase [Candidatus Nealsonbacteria bacterium]